MNNDDRHAEYLEGGTLDDSLGDAARPNLDELRRLLATSSTWDDPPPGLADTIVASLRDDHVTPSDAGRGRAARSASSPRRRWLQPALAAAAVAVVAVGVVLVIGDGGDGGDGGDSFSLAATDVMPEASGRATVEPTGSGLSISLTVEGLSPAEPGTFYQAWMRNDTDSVPIGTFHSRQADGAIELWSGVDVADYPTMTVTLQQEGAGPESSGVVVLRGAIPSP